MPADAILMDRVRGLLLLALPPNPDVEEKKMFNGVAFMVNGKMCICVSNDEIMCRINPLIHEEMVEKPGCRAMEMKGKPYKGFVYVENNAIAGRDNLNFWINLCLEYNPLAKASAKKKKK